MHEFYGLDGQMRQQCKQVLSGKTTTAKFLKQLAVLSNVELIARSACLSITL